MLLSWPLDLCAYLKVVNYENRLIDAFFFASLGQMTLFVTVTVDLRILLQASACQHGPS